MTERTVGKAKKQVMKISKLLQMLMFGIGASPFMGVVDDNGGGGAGGSDGGDGGAGGSDGGDNKQPDGGKPDGDKGSKISDSEAKLLKEVMDKKNALKKANDDLAAAKTRLAEFDGIDPAAIKALLQEKKDAETKQMEAKGEWDRLKAQMADEHGKEKKTLLDQLQAANDRATKLEGTIAELTVGSAFAQSKFIQDELALTPSKTRVVYGPHFEFKDGNVVGYDKPAGSANRTPLVDASGEPLSFEVALKKIVEADPDRDQLLRSKVKAGAGSNTSNKTATPPADASKVETAGRSRIASALNKGVLAKK